MKNKKIVIAVVALVVVVGLMLGAYFATRTQVQQGTKEITVTVVHRDGTEKVLTFRTDAEHLGDALVEKELLTPDAAETGMFDTVDGETAVWADNESWWALYEGDAFATEGVNTLVIEDGDTFRLVFTNGYAG